MINFCHFVSGVFFIHKMIVVNKSGPQSKSQNVIYYIDLCTSGK